MVSPMKQAENEKVNRRRKAALIRDFLRGSKRYFAVAILSASVASLAELVNPQIIRVALDHVIGSRPTDALAAPVRALLERAGGAAYLRAHL